MLKRAGAITFDYVYACRIPNVSGQAVAAVSRFELGDDIACSLGGHNRKTEKNRDIKKNRRTHRVHFTYQDKSNFENRIAAVLRGGFSTNLT
jgi:hypothetical protein